MSDPRPGAFDPEGDGYDYRTAKAAGMSPGPNGRWDSREPKSGQILKGRKHPTFAKTLKAERELGYEIEKRADGKYYTVKKKKPGTGNHPRNK